MPTMASTSGCVLVMQCIVVMEPCTMPMFSLMTLIGGAMQFVVQEAAVTMWCFGSAASYSSWLQP